MSKYSKYSGLPPYIVSMAESWIRYLDRSWLTERPHFSLEFRGWKMLSLPPIRREPSVRSQPHPSTETDDYQN